MGRPQYEQVTVMTLSSNGVPKAHLTEDDALQYIEEQIGANPAFRYTMFKPYQKVEPRKVDIKELIRGIE